MPIGVIVNGLSVLLGGGFGAVFGSKLSPDLKNKLNLIFGVSSMSMGISYIGKVNTLPAVIFSVIVGLIIGELIHLGAGIEKGARAVQRPISAVFKHNGTDMTQEEFMERLVSIIVLFCASGTGIFGALNSGMTGDHTVLLTKSILDFFTAAIFAANLGIIVSTICVPQVLIMLVLFYSANFILPMTTDIMRADFTACGGILMLATGLRIAGIKSFPIADMIPAMLLVMPFSHLWVTYLVPLLS